MCPGRRVGAGLIPSGRGQGVALPENLLWRFTPQAAVTKISEPTHPGLIATVSTTTVSTQNLNYESTSTEEKKKTVDDSFCWGLFCDEVRLNESIIAATTGETSESLTEILGFHDFFSRPIRVAERRSGFICRSASYSLSPALENAGTPRGY